MGAQDGEERSLIWQESPRRRSVYHQKRGDDTSKELPGALAATVGDWQVCSSRCEDRLWVHIC